MLSGGKLVASIDKELLNLDISTYFLGKFAASLDKEIS